MIKRHENSFIICIACRNNRGIIEASKGADPKAIENEMETKKMMTEEQKMVVARFVADHNGGEPEDYVDDVVATAEPAENFRRIAKSARVDKSYGDGLRLDGVQRKAGQARSIMYIIDFGGFRGIVEM